MRLQLLRCLPGVTSIGKVRRATQLAGPKLVSCKARRADECLPPWESTRYATQQQPWVSLHQEW